MWCFPLKFLICSMRRVHNFLKEITDVTVNSSGPLSRWNYVITDIRDGKNLLGHPVHVLCQLVLPPCRKFSRELLSSVLDSSSEILSQDSQWASLSGLVLVWCDRCRLDFWKMLWLSLALKFGGSNRTTPSVHCFYSSVSSWKWVIATPELDFLSFL